MKFTLTDLRKYFNVDLRDNDKPEPKGQPITPEQAAFWAGISLQTWNKIEQGKANPRKSTLEKISKKFRVNIDDIVVGQDKPEEQEEQVTEPATVNDEEQKQTTNNQEEETKMKKVTLTQLRAQYELTQEQAAKKAHVTVQTWNNVEKGLHKPQIITLGRIAKAFDVKPEEIMIGYEETEKIQNAKTAVNDLNYELVNYASILIDDNIKRLNFLSAIGQSQPKSFNVDKNVLWVNYKDGRVLSDVDFKKHRIEEAIANLNNDPKISIASILDGLTLYAWPWKPVNLSVEAKSRHNHPLALLHYAVSQLHYTDYIPTLIKDAVDHVQNHGTYYDYEDDVLWACSDGIHYETDKKFRENQIGQALYDWNDASDECHKEIAEKYNDENFYNDVEDNNEWAIADGYKTFNQVAEKQAFDREHAYENPFKQGTELYDAYDKWLINDAKQVGYYSDLLASRLQSGSCSKLGLSSLIDGGLTTEELADTLEHLSNDSILEILIDQVNAGCLYRKDIMNLSNKYGVIDDNDIKKIYGNLNRFAKQDWDVEETEAE